MRENNLEIMSQGTNNEQVINYVQPEKIHKIS